MNERYMTDEDRLGLIDDLNERGVVEGHDDYQAMIGRALRLGTYQEAYELRVEYGIE